MNRVATSTGCGASSSFPRVTTTPGVFVQRSCACGESASLGAKCEDCANGKLKLQRSAVADGSHSDHLIAPLIVHDVLRSPGQPLDQTQRAGMEAGLGHDFSRVRVHTDAARIASAPVQLARAPDDPQPTTTPPTSSPTPSGDAGTGTSSSAPPNTTPADPTATPDAGQKPPPPKKKVCLTFDDGPKDPGTMDVLNALGGSIKATFFLQGSKMVATERLMQPGDPLLPAATKQAELVAQILAKGHQIANHTFWHVPFQKTQYDALMQKPQAEQDKTITEGFTKNLAYFQRLYEDHKEAFAAQGITSFPGFQLGRLPGAGKEYPPYVALVEGLGLKHVGWNTEFAPKGGLGAPLGTADWKGVTGLDAEIKENKCVANNWILLLHDPLWGGKQALLESLIQKLKTGCNAEFGVLNASGACS